MTQQTCPDNETLEKLLLGRVTRAELESWENHLSHCGSCVERAANSVHADRLIQAIRSPSPLEISPTKLETLRELGRQVFEDTSVQRLDQTSELDGNQSRALDTVLESSASAHPFDFLDAAQGDDEIGRLAGYRVQKMLGRGGMGMVFLAEDETLHRRIALKVMSPTLPRSGAERFLREARAMAAVVSDHVVPVYQVGQHHQIPFLAMQLLDGESLADRMRRERQLPIETLCQIGEQAATGLAAAHKQGLIHRDIKPDNLWLETPNDRVKILDFGLARGFEETGLTQSGTVVGTPRYMSPEQAESKAVDHRSDLFSLGAVLYEAAAGTPAFEGDSLTSTLFAIVSQTPGQLSDKRSDLPESLAKLISHLLEKRPNDRPDSADAVAEAFRQLRINLASESQSDVVRNHTAPPQALVRRPKTPTPLRRYLSAVAIALLFITLFAGVLIQWKTPAGTVFLTIDSAEQPVEVDVQKESLTIVDPNDNQPVRVTVDLESKAMRLEKNGFQATTTQFELTSRDGRFVSVRFEPIAPRIDSSPMLHAAEESIGPATDALTPDGPMPGDTTKQRQIAEWIFSRGGSVQVQCQGRRHPEVLSDLQSLPREAFQFSSVRFDSASNVNDADLAYLTNIPNAFELWLVGMPLTGECFQTLGKAEKLSGLNVSGCYELQPQYLMELVSCPLTTVFASQSNLGDELAELIRGNPMLRQVDFGAELTRTGLGRLSGCQHLRQISLAFCYRLNGADLEWLKAIPNLSDLRLRESDLTPQSVQQLAALPALRTIRIANDEFTDDSIALLAEITQLETLDLSWNSLESADLSPLTRLKSLRSLSLLGAEVSEKQLAELRSKLKDCEIVTE